MDNDYIIQLITKLDGSKTADDLKKIEQQLNAKGINLKTSLNTATSKQQLQELAKQLQSVLKSSGLEIDTSKIMSAFSQVSKEADKLAQNVNRIQLSFDNGHGDSDYQNRITAITNELIKYGLSADEANKKTENLRTILDGFKVNGNFLPDKQLIAQADKLEAEFKAVKVSVDSAKLSFDKFLQPVSSEKASSLIVRINSFLSKNTAITAEAKAELQSFVAQLNNGVNLGEWNQFNLRLKEIEDDMRRAGKLGKSLKQTLIEGAKSFAQWTFSSGAVMEVWQGIKKVYNASLDLDKAITNLNMATDLNEKQINSLVDSYSKLGDKLNATLTDVIESGTEWLKQGQSIGDTETLITNAMILSKIAGLSSADATKYLTSAMKGYQVAAEDTLNVVDKLSAVDMASATDVGGLAEGMSEVASSAELAGVSMDKLLGYLATIGEVTQSGMSQVGTTLNAVFSRMGNIKLSRLTDYETGEDLSNVETVLKGVQISLRDSNDSFRDFDEVLDETANRWTSFSETQQRAIASAFAGTRNQNEFIILMENYGKAMEYAEVSTDSSGEALEKFGDYQKSVTAHTDLFNKAIQDFAKTAVDSGLVNFFIDLGTGAIKFLDGTTKLLTPLGTLAASIGAFAGIKNVGEGKMHPSICFE